MSTIAEVLASQQSYVGTYTAGNFDSMKEDIARWAEKNPDSPFAADPTFTRSKGGTAEREEPINGITVPDLWHLYLALKDGKLTRNKKILAKAAEDVYEAWHLAHDMKRHLQSNS